MELTLSPNREFRGALGYFGDKNAGGIEIGQMHNYKYGCIYTENTYYFDIGKGFGFRGAHREGVGYLSGLERGGILTGVSIEIYWQYVALLTTYSSINYVYRGICRNISELYVGIRLGVALF